MSPECQKVEQGEMVRQLLKYFTPTEDSQQSCHLCGETLVESAITSDKNHVVTKRTACEGERCPYIEQDVMFRIKGSEWVVETPPWPSWDPESYDGAAEKLAWFLIALQSIQETPTASTEVPAQN